MIDCYISLFLADKKVIRLFGGIIGIHLLTLLSLSEGTTLNSSNNTNNSLFTFKQISSSFANCQPHHPHKNPYSNNATIPVSVLYELATITGNNNKKKHKHKRKKKPIKHNRDRRSLNYLRSVFKKMKKTYHIFEPEVELTVCAHEYVVSTLPTGVEFINNTFPVNYRRNVQQARKIKHKHKHIHFMVLVKTFTDTIYLAMYEISPIGSEIIRMQLSPIMFGLGYVLEIIQFYFEHLSEDHLFQCIKGYLLKRFCLWIDS